MVGFWEERQAGNAIAALKAKLAIKARVKRDGTWITPEARELVPGDAIRHRAGGYAAAGRRPDRSGSVRADGRVAARRAALKIGNYLIILAVALVAVIITVALFRSDPILTTLQFALVLTVAAISVAMPFIFRPLA